ncbi:MAG TPA: cytochrome c biogenesis protein CcsA [Kofleriaceae bacterium]|nr:cytochrome c biogenesis protein CcsA [Kofleriaceae bacterium]
MTDATVITVAPSPAFYVALILYGVAALLYVSAFVEAPRWMVPAARWALLAAFVTHGIDIGWRGVLHVHPATSVREALGFLSWVMVGGYLWWAWRVKLAMLGAFVAPAALAILALARLSPSGEPMAGLSALGRVHISLATLGVAIFALATAIAVMYLFEDRSIKRKEFDRVLFKRGAALETLDRLSHRLVVIGFPIFTASVMLGVVWGAQRAELLSRPEWWIALVTWASFGGLLVARTTHGWRGRKAAVLTIMGFTASVAVLAIYLARRALGG